MSIQSTRRFGMLRFPIALLVFTTLLVSPALASSHDDSGKVVKVRKFGNPVTAFVPGGAHSVADLQAAVTKHRSDFEAALRMSGWPGDPRDFFAAIERGDVERVAIPVGTTFHWMGFRKNKKPTVTRNVEWAGKAPADAWQVKVPSNGKVYTFVLPVVCLNVALHGMEDVEKLTCELSARAGDGGMPACGELATIVVKGSTNGDSMELTSITGPGRPDASAARSSGSYQWTFKPSHPGSFEFTATAKGHGQTATCKASVTIPEAKPCVRCELRASYDEDTKTFTIDGSDSLGRVEITSIRLADGSSGDLSKLVPAGENRWTYRAKVPRRAGSYTYTFAGTAENEGARENCDASVTVDAVRGVDGAWIFRAFGAAIRTDGGEVFTSRIRPDGSSERTHSAIESGTGFGLGLEYLFTDRVGLELSAIFADLDTKFVFDIDDQWESGEADLDFRPISLGLNFHLTPDRPFDFFIGPLIAHVGFGDVEFRLLGETQRRDFDDEFTFGLNLGVDVPARQGWAFHAGLRYFDLDAEDDSVNLEYPVDPLIFMAGAAYRF